MSDNKQKVEVSLPIAGLLGVLFVALKLTGVITWSWWWVTLPFWGGLAVALVVLVCFLAMLAFLGLVDSANRKNVNQWRR